MARTPMTDRQMEQVSKSTAEILNAQPKVKIKLHLPAEELKKLQASKEAGKNVEWPYEFVSINGYNFQIQKGVPVEVPQSVAEVLEQAGMI